jgi:hypothetical protein
MDPQPPDNSIMPPEDAQPPAATIAAPATPRHEWLRVAIIFLILLLLTAGSWALFNHYENQLAQKANQLAAAQKTHKTTVKTKPILGLQLDTAKNYGNKYANGILPVGDGKYSTSTAAKGTVYACQQYAQNFGTDRGGAGVRGPWFGNSNTTYDLNKKVHVQGAATWQAEYSIKVVNGVRTIVTNDLPSHPTGIFPIAASDPAYAYDRNPNSIKSQSLTYSLNASPTYGAPNCMGGEVGVMTTGIALYNAFDAGGRDAGAWEVQDSCGGHPQKEGEYHYHTLSSCIKDVSVKTVIGYALDGFPITGPQHSYHRRFRRMPRLDQPDKARWQRHDDLSLRDDRGFSIFSQLFPRAGDPTAGYARLVRTLVLPAEV